jgi:hypothetical protein
MSADHKTLLGSLDVMGITGEIAVIARNRVIGKTSLPRICGKRLSISVISVNQW